MLSECAVWVCIVSLSKNTPRLGLTNENRNHNLFHSRALFTLACGDYNTVRMGALNSYLNTKILSATNGLGFVVARNVYNGWQFGKCLCWHIHGLWRRLRGRTYVGHRM